MPVIGQKKVNTMGNGYGATHPMHEFANAYRDVMKSIMNEAGVDVLTETTKALLDQRSNDSMKQFFVENSTYRDPSDPNADAVRYQDHQSMMEAQYENDREAYLEHCGGGSFNPVMGLVFPMHKNVLMNNVFDKGAIPKAVLRQPKETITMERRILVAPDGKEIDFFTNQMEMYDAIEAATPFKEVELTVPSMETTDIITAVGGVEGDDLSIETYISAVKVKIYLEQGDLHPVTGEKHTGEAAEEDVWFPVNYKFATFYGEYDRVLAQKFMISAKKKDNTDVKTVIYKDVLNAYIKNNKVGVSSAAGVITAVKLKTRLDSSNAQCNCASVKWGETHELIEVPDARPINTTISPNEVKDIAALYNVNQLTRIMELMTTALGEYKDTSIKKKLDESFNTMPDTNKNAYTFDMVPRQGYAGSAAQYRRETFIDKLDTQVSELLQVLNDPNMTISVFGRPDLIRKITPTEYTFKTPSQIGPVTLDYVKVVSTSDDRTYQFIGTDKLRGNNNLIIILCPHNSNRIIYQIYDYQMYLSNEIRNSKNPSLPSLHGFERWTFKDYQPVQGRMQILNPMGSSKEIPNYDPIGNFESNDFNANKPFVEPKI